jgi:hypothetical protein
MLMWPLLTDKRQRPGFSGVTIFTPHPQQQLCAAVEYFFDM